MLRTLLIGESLNSTAAFSKKNKIAKVCIQFSMWVYVTIYSFNTTKFSGFARYY